MGWLTKGAARRRAEHYRDAQQREWEASSAIPRVFASGPSSSVATPVTVYFSDGPLEGQTFVAGHKMRRGDSVTIPYPRKVSFGEWPALYPTHIYILKQPTGDGDWST